MTYVRILTFEKIAANIYSSGPGKILNRLKKQLSDGDRQTGLKLLRLEDESNVNSSPALAFLAITMAPREHPFFEH